MCWFHYTWIDESSTTLAVYPRARHEHTTLNINVIFILRYVNWKQMEIFFSLRPEGRENKLPFPLLANKERKSLSRAGVIAMCAESLLQPAFFCYAIFIYISITSASLWENVSLLMWACAHWGCHLGSQYRHRGRQCLNGSAGKLGLLSHINMHEGRHPGAPRPINICHFRFSLHYLLQPPSHLLQKPRLLPTSLTPRVISTSCRAGWLQLVWCQGKFCTHIMMSENILAFLGGLIYYFVHSINLLGRLCRQ